MGLLLDSHDYTLPIPRSKKLVMDSKYGRVPCDVSPPMHSLLHFGVFRSSPAGCQQLLGFEMHTVLSLHFHKNSSPILVWTAVVLLSSFSVFMSRFMHRWGVGTWIYIFVDALLMELGRSMEPFHDQNLTNWQWLGFVFWLRQGQE